MSRVKRLRSSKTTLNDDVEKKVVLPMDVTVEHKRAVVRILSFGSAPYYVDNDIYVPNGFRVEKFRDGEWWYGETSVSHNGGLATYRFVLKRNLEVASSWRKTPTEAYKEVAKRVGKRNDQWEKGVNGRILIGVHYPAIQELIKKERARDMESVEFGLMNKMQKVSATADVEDIEEMDTEDLDTLSKPQGFERSYSVEELMELLNDEDEYQLPSCVRYDSSDTPISQCIPIEVDSILEFEAVQDYVATHSFDEILDFCLRSDLEDEAIM